MAIKSVYMPEPAVEGGILRIRGDEHRHLSVGRIDPDEAVEIFDGKGNIWAATVVSHSRNETVLRIAGQRTAPKDPYEIVLGLALIRPAAFELALEKVVEAGVTSIVPLIAERSNVQAGERGNRWLRIIVEAAKQAKRYHLPRLEAPLTFAQAMTLPAASKILLAEREGASLKPAIAGAPVLYLVGPEGGWSDKEFEEARRAGFSLVSLGQGILKAETAAIIGAALIRYELSSV